jgi:AAA domain
MSSNESVVAKVPHPQVAGGLPGEDPKEKFRYLNVLAIGPSGLGKTTFAATAIDDPRTSPVLFLNWEGGGELRLVEKDPTKYTLRTISKMEDLNFYYEYLAKGDHPYKSVVIDSLTETQKLGLAEFVYGKSGDKIPKKDIVSIKTAEIQHWGKSGLQMAMLLRLFRDLRMHVIFTGLDTVVKDELTGKVNYTIALPGKQATEIPGIPDIVGWMDTMKDPKDLKNLKRVMKFQPDGKIQAKDRTDALGAGMMDPSVTKMLDFIFERYQIPELAPQK